MPTKQPWRRQRYRRCHELAVLDSDEIEHGPLECLFTTSEETGMDGALAVKEGQTHGQYLLNIDTEVEGEFVVSCAGGCRVDVEIPRLRDNRDSQSRTA